MKRIFSILLFFALIAAFSGCMPVATPLAPEPSGTPLPPTQTPTSTVVWFPPTPTYTPFPTLVITPTADMSPPVGAILLSDDFSVSSPWDLGQTASTSIALANNELTLAINQPGAYLYSLRQQPELGNFYLEVTASPSLCRGSDEYGLLLRFTQSNNFYRFSLSCDGQVRLDKYFDGRASSPKPWTLSGAFLPGALGSSRLEVWARGAEMRFYINNQYQFTVNDPSIPGGSLGVFVRSAGDTAVTVSFSDLAIYRVPN